MRPLLLCVALVCACGRSDVVNTPPSAVVERELRLDDGDMVLVEVHVGDDDDLRGAVLAVRDGVSLPGLVDTIAMDDEATLVLDATGEPRLVVEVDGVARAYIWR